MKAAKKLDTTPMDFNQEEPVLAYSAVPVPGLWEPDGPPQTLLQKIQDFKLFWEFLETDEDFEGWDNENFISIRSFLQSIYSRS